MSGKTIVVLATLDTKGREAQYLRECIEQRGHRALLIDTSVVGTVTAVEDVPREEVAAAGGRPLAELLQRPTREEAAPVMAAAATKLIASLDAKGQAHAVLSLG